MLGSRSSSLIFILLCTSIFSKEIFSDVPISAVEKFWDKKPCDIDFSQKPLSKAFFDEVEHFRYTTQTHIPEFAEFERWHGKKVLEIGCGIGTEAINFVQAGADYTAIELSGKSLDVTKKRFEIYGLNARLIHGNAEELDKYLGNEKFDLIWSHGVIHHSPHPERIIAQCEKILKPDSELRIMLYARVSVPVFRWMLDCKILDLNRANELAARNGETQANSPVTYTYTYSSIRRLLRNFDIISMKKVIMGHANFLEKVSQEEFKDLEEELGWFILIRAQLHNKGTV